MLSLGKIILLILSFEKNNTRIQFDIKYVINLSQNHNSVIVFQNTMSNQRVLEGKGHPVKGVQVWYTFYDVVSYHT